MTAWELLIQTCAAAPLRGVLVCAMPGCEVEFTPKAHNQRFCCEKHSKAYNDKFVRDRTKSHTRKEAQQ